MNTSTVRADEAAIARPKYYEMDGALRANANRAWLLAFLTIPIALVAIGFASQSQIRHIETSLNHLTVLEFGESVTTLAIADADSLLSGQDSQLHPAEKIIHDGLCVPNLRVAGPAGRLKTCMRLTISRWIALSTSENVYSGSP
jgi:hypothetical protein